MTMTSEQERTFRDRLLAQGVSKERITELLRHGFSLEKLTRLLGQGSRQCNALMKQCRPQLLEALDRHMAKNPGKAFTVPMRMKLEPKGNGKWIVTAKVGWTLKGEAEDGGEIVDLEPDMFDEQVKKSVEKIEETLGEEVSMTISGAGQSVTIEGKGRKPHLGMPPPETYEVNHKGSRPKRAAGN